MSPYRRDHPRVCGENVVELLVLSCFAGSPPRMRGEPPDDIVASDRHGITPAYAGRTMCILPLAQRTPDHPRVCGENPSTVSTVIIALGSPPRMRGELIRHVMPCHVLGITPAYAGRTLEGQIVRDDSTDHPRVCGENDAGGLHDVVEEGSPPRMRGEHRAVSTVIADDGITPAYAGRTVV